MIVPIRLSPGQIPIAAKTVARRSGLIAIPVLLFAGFMILLSVLPIFVRTSNVIGSAFALTAASAALAAPIVGMPYPPARYLDGLVVIPHVRGAPDRSLSFAVPPKLHRHLATAGRYVPPPA